MRIEAADTATARYSLPQLKALLIATVNDGASIGWLPPLSDAAAEAYWLDRFAAIDTGGCVLLLAWDDDQTLAGSAQLSLEQRDNGNHRAEVQKVMVHPGYRRRGIGRQLMLALEDAAMQHNRTLLVLDTRAGDPSEVLYRQVGYVKAGVIPQYARSAGGALDAAAFYYKILS